MRAGQPGTFLFFLFSNLANRSGLGISNLLLEIIWVGNNLACKSCARGTAKGNWEMGSAKVIWIGCASVARENNRTKGEAPEGNGSTDATLTFWGGVNSPKPSLCEMVAALDIYEENATRMKIEAKNGEAYGNTSWGSTGVPTGSSVRAVGI